MGGVGGLEVALVGISAGEVDVVRRVAVAGVGEDALVEENVAFEGKLVGLR
jgi:hypothetical protein